MDLLLVGAPGSGKGTQAGQLAGLLGVPHVSSGDLFRSNMDQGTPLGREAKAYVTSGRLVPDELTVRMVEDRLRAPDAAGGSVLDGFPRTVPQAEALDRMLASLGRRVDRVVVIEVPEGELLSRLSGRRLCRTCGRSYHVRFSAPRVPGRCDVDGGELYQREDDTEERARRRLADYREKTAPVVAHYRRRPGVVVEVDGFGSIGEVGRRLAAAVRPSDGRREGAR